MDVVDSLLSLSNCSRISSSSATSRPNTDGKKEQYVRSIQHFKTWIIEEYPSCFDTVTDKFCLQLFTDTIIIQFFMSRSLYPDGRCKSSSSINGYKRAIRSLFKSYGVPVSDSLNKIIDEYETADVKRKYSALVPSEAERALKRQAFEISTDLSLLPLPMAAAGVSYEDFEAAMEEHKMKIMNSLSSVGSTVTSTAGSEILSASSDYLIVPSRENLPILTGSPQTQVASASSSNSVNRSSSEGFLADHESLARESTSVLLGSPVKPTFQTWIWKSRVHAVPQNFVFPQ